MKTALPLRHSIAFRMLLALCLAAPLPLAAQDDDLPYAQRQDVVYAETHGAGLLMDIFTPKEKPNGLAIVDVASGAWFSDRGKIRDHTIAQIYRIFCTQGYVVFAPRPGSKTRFTAADMEQHVKLAIRYAKEHAAGYKVDPARLGLTGASAGAHLALLAALTPEAGRPDAKNPLERHGSSVRAAGVFFPPTDFLDWSGDGKLANMDLLGPLLFPGGAKGRTEEELVTQARAISPVHRIGKPALPFFLIHGDADKLVPLAQSQKFVAAIKAAGGQAELLVKPGGGHPWPTLPEEVKVLANWFNQQLNAPSPAVAK